MIEVKLNVVFGVTDTLRDLVKAVLNGVKGSEPTPTQIWREPMNPNVEATEAPAKQEAPEPVEEVTAEEPTPEAPEAPEPVETVIAEEPAVKEVTPPTNEEMKTLMDITVSKFAGNNWQEAKDSKTLALVKSCTKAFKMIARHLGAEKPTALEGDKRTAFIKHLDEILIRDGLAEWEPF